MSDTMLFGVLTMPYEMAMADELSRKQFYARVQELVTRVEAAQKQKPSAIPADFKNSPRMGIFDSLTEAQQEVILNAAHYVMERFEADDRLGALEQYEEFQGEERIALHDKLPSHVRTALRKFKESLKEAA